MAGELTLAGLAQFMKYMVWPQSCAHVVNFFHEEKIKSYFSRYHEIQEGAATWLLGSSCHFCSMGILPVYFHGKNQRFFSLTSSTADESLHVFRVKDHKTCLPIEKARFLEKEEARSDI